MEETTTRNAENSPQDSPHDVPHDQRQDARILPSEPVEAESSRDSLDIMDAKFGDPVYPGDQASATTITSYKRKVEEYSREMRQTMRECNLNGRDLWIQFTCAFRVPSIQHMAASSQLAWIVFLRNRGVKIDQTPGSSFWKALRDCILSEEYPEGNIGDSSVMHEGKLDVPYATNLAKQTTGTSQAGNLVATNENASVCKTPVKYPLRTKSNSFFNRSGSSSTTTQGVSTMIKAYTSRTKFKGRFDEDLNAAIEQFETMASVFDLSEEEKGKAFPTILEGSAFKHYTRVYKNRSPSYEEQLREFRSKYISAEQQQRLLQKWEKPSLTDLMRQSPNKSEMEIFRELCDELSSIQMQLPASYHDDIFLRDKLLVACDIPHIHELLLDKVPQNSQEAMQRVAARLSYEPRSAGVNTTTTSDDALYSLERKYGGDARRQFKGYTKTKKKTNLSRKLAAAKGCWVCQGQHHARNNHSTNDIIEAIERIKKAPSTVYSTELLGDYEWALIENQVEESDDEPADNTNGNTNDQAQSQEQKDTTQFVFQELECILSDSSFAHGRTFEKDMTQSLNVMNAELQKGEESTFEGIVIDTGANRSSVMSLAQYKAYCKTFHTVPNVRNDKLTNSLVGLGGHTIQAVGTAHIPIPFTELDLIIDVDFRIIKDNTTSILSLMDLKRNGLDISVQRDKVIFGNKEQNLLFENDLLKHKWTQSTIPYVLYTNTELEKLHRNFGHPSASALHKLLKRADISKVSLKTMESIEDIVRRCTICQKYSPAPRRFKITVGTEDLKFNHVVAVDLMFISKKPILHVVDEATHFMGAQFLKSHSSADVWKALLRCWSRLYLGPPDHLRIDQGSNFVSQEFLDCATTEGIIVLEAPIESPSTMSHVERYHGPLRRAYLKIRESLPRRETDADCLQLAVKSMNDTVGPEGLCPTLLVFGALPRAAKRQPASSQLERAKALDGARQEVLQEYAKRKISFAMKHTGAPKAKEHDAALHNLPYGAPVYVYRDKPANWTGPFPFIQIDGSTVVVQLPHGRRIFRSTAVKAKVPPSISSLDLYKPFTYDVKDSPKSTTEDKVAVNSAAVDFLLNTSTIEAPLPLASTENYLASRRKEINGLIQANVFEIADRSSVPAGSRIYGCRFVDSKKTNDDGTTYCKSRLVAQNFRDKDALSIMTKSPTVSRLGQRISVATAAMFPTHAAYTRDISQAYIQSETTLNRSVYVNAPAEMELPSDKLLLVKKPLYGIPESGLHWFMTYHRHHTDHLKMKQTCGDSCVLYKRQTNQLDGITIP